VVAAALHHVHAMPAVRSPVPLLVPHR